MSDSADITSVHKNLLTYRSGNYILLIATVIRLVMQLLSLLGSSFYFGEKIGNQLNWRIFTKVPGTYYNKDQQQHAICY